MSRYYSPLSCKQLQPQTPKWGEQSIARTVALFTYQPSEGELVREHHAEQ